MENNFLNDVLNNLNIESYSTSTVRRGRPQKLKTAAGSIGVSLARQQDDPLYKKMIFHKHMYMDYKEKLQRKYKSRALSLARKKASTYKN